MSQRVTLDISDKMLDLLKDLQVRTGKMTIGEVLQAAASVYGLLIEEHEKGNQIRICSSKGKPLHQVKVILDRKV